MVRTELITPTLDTNLHSTGDVFLSPTTFDNMAPNNGNGIILDHITGWDTSGVYGGWTLYFFDGDSSDLAGTYTLNANPVFGTDHSKILGIVEVDEQDWVIQGSDAFIDIPVGRLMIPNQVEGKITIMGVCGSQVTFTSADSLGIRLSFKDR